MTKRAIIIDTDPGIDDAVALAIALHSEELDIRLITTVAGNVGLDKTTSNALKILKFYGKSIPVAQGAKVPLIRTPVEAKSVHGESGMDGWDFEPGDERNLTKENAVDAMHKVIMSSKEPITLVPIAPLTNIALLFETYPEVKANIKEIIMMGGSLTRGNFGVMSEFNIGADPEAAKMVFAAGVPLTMVGLDVGWKALIYPEDTAKIKEFGKSGEMIHALFSHYRQNGMKNGLKMYDACALAYLLKPEMFQVESCFADVETKGELTYGCTVCDLKGYLKKEKNITVTTDINAQMFTDWLLSALHKMAR